MVELPHLGKKKKKKISEIWKQPKCTSRDEWIKKLWHIYTYICNGILLSHIKIKLPFIAIWVDLEDIMLS